MEYVLLAILLVCAVVITVAVLFQKSGEKGLSGTIAGGAETFFGKNKGRTMEAKLVKLTKIVGISFFVIAFAAKVITTIL